MDREKLEDHLLHQCKFEECHVCQQNVTQQQLNVLCANMVTQSEIVEGYIPLGISPIEAP